MLVFPPILWLFVLGSGGALLPDWKYHDKKLFESIGRHSKNSSESASEKQEEEESCIITPSEDLDALQSEDLWETFKQSIDADVLRSPEIQLPEELEKHESGKTVEEFSPEPIQASFRSDRLPSAAFSPFSPCSDLSSSREETRDERNKENGDGNSVLVSYSVYEPPSFGKFRSNPLRRLAVRQNSSQGLQLLKNSFRQLERAISADMSELSSCSEDLNDLSCLPGSFSGEDLPDLRNFQEAVPSFSLAIYERFD
jgi:hypothetical protein